MNATKHKRHAAGTNAEPTKHTPGEWAKDYTLSGQLIIKGASPYTGKPFARKVATISDHSKSAYGQKETEANALLIAAAPALCDALSRTLEALETAHEYASKTAPALACVKWAETEAAARRAIAQAEGRN